MWDIVTTPEHMGRWFGDAGRRARRRRHQDALGGARRGGAARRPLGAADTRSPIAGTRTIAGIGDTLVEFTLATEGDGTRVTVVESGWTKLRTDADEQARLREGNVGGWKHELGDLERYAQTVAV